MLTDRRDPLPGDGPTGAAHDGRDVRAGANDGQSELPGDGARAPGGARRLVLHVAALAVALFAIVLITDNGALAITDEGAVIAQVEAVANGNWGIERPLPSVDPDGEFVTMENSDVVGDTYRPYAKHPAYPVLLLPFWRVGGHLGLLLASALGAWAAAVIGMFLCRRLVVTTPLATPATAAATAERQAGVTRRTEDLGLVTLWLLGLVSPLLFGATTIMAHSLGAAMCGAVVLALVSGLDDGVPTRRRFPLIALALILAVPLVLLRSEGLLAVAGIAAAVAVCSIRSLRPPRLDVFRFVTAVALAGLGVASYLLDGRLAAAIQGEDGINNFVISPQEVGFVEGRLLALWASVLRPGDPRLGLPAVVLLVATLCLVGGAVVLRYSPRRTSMAVQLVVAGAALTVVRQFLPLGHVTGMVAAFPLLVMGLVQLRRTDVTSLTAKVCLLASAVTASLVLATSYSIGGAAEWGGRFYHVLLPLLVPLVVLGTAAALERLPQAATDADDPTRNPPPLRSRGTDSDAEFEAARVGSGRVGSARVGSGRGTARVLTVAVLVAGISMSVLCVRTGIAMRQGTAVVIDRLLEVASSSAAPNDGGPPIVVTDSRGLGRGSWDHLDEVRILRMPRDGQLEGLLERLADADVGAVVLAVHPAEDIGAEVLGEWQVVGDDLRPGQAWRHVELVQGDPADG